MKTRSSNEFLYLTVGIVLAVMGVLAAINPDATVGLYALAGVGGVILAVAIILQPVLGANILIIAIFTNISDLLARQSGPSVIKPLVLLVAGAIAVHYAYNRQIPAGRSKTTRIELFLFVYFFVVAASYLVATNKDLAALEILDFAKDIVIIYCIQFAIRESDEWKESAWVIMVTTAFLCLLSAIQSITGNYQQTFFGMSTIQQDQVFGTTTTPRLAGPINAPNIWGQILVAVVPYIAYRILRDKSKTAKLLALVFLALVLLAVFNTYSRGAYVVLALIFVLILFDLRVSPMLAVGAAALLLIGVFFLPPGYRDRFATLADLNPTTQNGIYQDTSFRGRSSEMLTGLEMFSQHPLLGLGAANYKINYQKYARLIGIETRAEDRDAHSLYVQILAETGILGFLAFAGFAIALLIGLSQARNAVKDIPGLRDDWLPWLSASRLSIMSYLLTSIFLHNAYIRYFWILAAMAITAIQLTQQQLDSQLPKKVKSRSSLS